MSLAIDQMIERRIDIEGPFVDHPNDKGGPTRWGITEVVARLHGYSGPMNLLPRTLAHTIFMESYVGGPWFDKVAALMPALGEYLVDWGINSGPPTAAKALQRVLNVFNLQGTAYRDIPADGHVGPGTITALAAYRDKRGAQGEPVIVEALKDLRGAAFITIAEANPTQEDFVYGWIRTRVLGL